MTPLRVQAAACTLSFSGSSDLSRGILPRTFFLSFRGAKRRGVCCSPTLGQKQISRFARNDKGLGFVEAGLDTLLLVIPRSRSDEESAVLQFSVKSRFLASLEMTMRGIVGVVPTNLLHS